MELVSVAISSCNKMKVLLLLFFLSMAKTEDDTTERLKDIVDKYTPEAVGYPDLAKWIIKINRVLKEGNDMERASMLSQFQVYDTKRRYLDGLLDARIREIESLFPDRRLSQVCVDEYLEQKKILSNSYKLCIKKKLRNINQNSAKCTKVDTTVNPTPTKTTGVALNSTKG